ncbi:MAG: amidohydrolase family protein [Nanoarchaeota archaeon]
MIKKEVFFILIIFLIAIYGCTAPVIDDSKDAQEKVKQTGVQDQPAEEIKEEPVIKQEPVIAEPEPVAEKKEEFQLIYPQLTYEGAYNGPLYGTSEQVGSVSMDSYFENLDRNGINFFIGMFGISGEPAADTLISDQGLGEVIDAAQKHPYRVIPFFNPGIGGETIQKEGYLKTELLAWYTNTLTESQKIVGKKFIRGLGEIETQEWSQRHNDPKVLELIDLAVENNINFMFHPVASKIDDVEKIIEAYPDTIFLIHMFREDLAKSTSKLIPMLQEHENIYFSMDAAHIIHDNNMDWIYGYDSTDKQSSIKKLVSKYDSKEGAMTASAIKAYKPLVDAAPDKVMWGTEIGPEYAFDPKVFDKAVKISRFVIAGFDKEHQEAVGYKNALRVFGEGVVADENINVIDTSSWPECTDGQVSGCDEECEGDSGETAEFSPETEACFVKCTITQQCREVPEMDIG